jgi:hypothetical protein
VRIVRILPALALLSVLSADSAAAQATFRITSALLANSRTEVSVTFLDPLAATGPHMDGARVHLAGASGVDVTSITPSLLEQDVLTIALSQPLPPGDVQICFDRVAYVRASKTVTTTAEICATIGSDIEAAKAEALEVLVNTPVPSDEKTLRASGFVTVASDDSEGGIDLALSPRFSDPNMVTFLRLKTATAENGDPKSFEVGVAYRIGIPWNRQQIQDMREATDGAAINALLRARQRAFIAGSVVSVAVKLEGEPTTFGATNGVGDLEYDIRTMTRGLGASHGFWRGYVLPVGAEVGRKLGVDQSGAPIEDRAWIARYKTGAGFKIYYDNPTSALPIRRVDFDVNAVWRYLAVDELRFNPDTKAIDRTTDGGHGYAQFDLTLFLAESSSSLFGVKVSYSRGALPPVFATVRSVQFGFVLESNDDN